MLDYTQIMHICIFFKNRGQQSITSQHISTKSGGPLLDDFSNPGLKAFKPVPEEERTRRNRSDRLCARARVCVSMSCGCDILCLGCKVAGFDLMKGIPGPVNQASGHVSHVIAKPRERAPDGLLFLSLCACAKGTRKVTQPGVTMWGWGRFNDIV